MELHVLCRDFSIETISNLLQEYGFEIKSIGKEESPNEFELGNGKLIVLSSNNKKLEYNEPKK